MIILPQELVTFLQPRSPTRTSLASPFLVAIHFVPGEVQDDDADSLDDGFDDRDSGGLPDRNCGAGSLASSPGDGELEGKAMIIVVTVVMVVLLVGVAFYLGKGGGLDT